MFTMRPRCCASIWARSCLAGEEHRVEVQVYGGAPFRIGHIGEGFSEVGGEVVYKNIYAAELGNGTGNGRFKAIRAAGPGHRFRGLGWGGRLWVDHCEGCAGISKCACEGGGIDATACHEDCVSALKIEGSGGHIRPPGSG